MVNVPSHPLDNFLLNICLIRKKKLFALFKKKIHPIRSLILMTLTHLDFDSNRMKCT